MAFVGHGPVSASRVVISLYNLQSQSERYGRRWLGAGKGGWWKVESSVRG